MTDLVRIRGSPMEVLGTVLDTLVRSRLVIEEERGAELAYEVAHPLIAETIYQSIGRARRRALHRTVGQGLLAAGRLSEAAPHFTRAGDIGDPEAVSALTAALRLAEEREAFREALTLTGSLAELLPPGDDRWVAVADALAWPAEWVVDHRADVHTVMAVPALRAMDAVLEGHPEPGRQAKVKFRLTSFLNWGTGELEEAERHCQAALEFFEAAGDTRSMLLTANEAAWARCLRGDYRGFELSAAEVVERARRAGERGVELQAIIAQGFGALWGGRLEAARALSEESHRLASETGNVYRLPYTLAARAWVAALEGRVGESAPLLSEGKSLGLPYHDGLLVEWESWVHWMAGDFRASAQSALEVVAWNPEGLALRRLLNLAPGVVSLTETGRLPEARRLTAAFRAATGGRPWYSVLEDYYWLKGFLAWRDGDTTGAITAMGQAVGRFLKTGALHRAGLVLADLAEMGGEARATGVAAEAANQLEGCAQALDCDLYRALAAVAAAWAALGGGEAGNAVAAARPAAETLGRLGYRAFYGRALDVLGRAILATDPGGAARTLGEAAAVFDACGAGWRLEAAERALAVAGVDQKGAL